MSEQPNEENPFAEIIREIADSMKEKTPEQVACDMLAESLYDLFVALINKGFRRDEAFQLILKMSPTYGSSSS